MKQVSILAFLLLCGIVISSFENKPAADKENSFVLVELFTSQGCSSCPAADKVLSDIINESDDKPIYGLSFHVSYWNYLGWKDPYSSEAFTQRQRDYSQAMGRGQVYTPQMIVNGTRQFVGSNKTKAAYWIDKSLEEKHNYHLKLNLQRNENEINVNYSLNGETKGLIIHAAFVEKDLTNKVLRGENGGRTLHHDNVVREFETAKADSQGQFSLQVPENANIAKSTIIIYAQEEQSMKIVAATKAPIIQ